MKKYLLLCILFPVFYNSFGQISISEATELISGYIKGAEGKDYRLYQYPEKLPPETKILTFDKSITSISFDSWAFFIDKYPLAGWSHPCTYLFVNSATGKITEKNWILPPNRLDKWLLLNKMKEQQEVKLFDFTRDGSVSLRSGLTPSNCYAVIISGGYNMANNPKRYWNDCSAIYSALVNIYNYSDSHIYTLISDGTNPANDREIAPQVYDSSPLDLDGDGDDDIQYSATKSNISSVFNTLSNILDEDDYLYIFVTDHGDQESGQDVILYLWGETMRDDQFASEVDKVNAGEISIVMEQCYSGGFIDDLDNPNRVISTACKYNQPSCALSRYGYDEYVYHWISAVAGEDPYGNSVDADYNSDGYVSMYEAFIYAEYHDACSETPQYNSNKFTLGENLTLLGKELCITTDYIVDKIITTSQTIKDCEIVICGVTINNNANVIFEAENETYVLDDFEVSIGSILEIK